MAASLLAMVCGVTAKSKKHADRESVMLELRRELLAVQERLLENARLDAEAYDRVVEASRRRRNDPGEEAERSYESALKHASDVPMATAEACAEVLETGIKVAELGTRSAWSDTGTALSLAEAAFDGAAMNVRTNLELIKDRVYAESAEGRLDRLTRASRSSLSEARDKLGPPGGK
jgi:formiminotetrahydrofolate cyclodeaminase